ncbi:MAG: DUF342 domain-containing protein [Candidatus Sericytochromatia bacterium]
MIFYQFQLHYPRLSDRYQFQVYLTVQPLPKPQTGHLLTLRSLINFLKDQGITYGIHYRKLIEIVQMGGCKRQLVATGLLPEKGEDAYFEVLTSSQEAPFQKLLSDFKVDSNQNQWPDFKKNLKPANTPILRKHVATAGAPGMSVRGELISGVWGRDLAFPKMKNLRIEERDGHLLVSTIEGCPLIHLPHNIHIQPIYILDRDLNESRHFPGMVVINGSVQDHVRLSAEGDVFINGNVDAAVVLSGGNVFIAKGIKGKDMAVIKAAEHICLGFAERCTLEAQGSIYAKTLTQSYSVALDCVEADSIIGGETRATRSVRAKTIGSAGLISQLFIGNNPYLTDKINALQKEKAHCDVRLSEMRIAISEYVLKEKRSQEDIMLRHLRSRMPRLEFLLQKIHSQLEQLFQVRQNEKQAELICLDRLYAGTLIAMEPFETVLEKTVSKPVIYRSGRYGLIPSVYELKTHESIGKERI